MVHVEVLELGRRRKQDIGVVGRIGLEDIVDDAEEIVACEPRGNFARSRGATATGFEL